MIVILGITCNNAAFEPTINDEVSRLLSVAAEQAGRGEVSGILRDFNGNRVGKWEVRESDGLAHLGLE